MKHPKYHEYYLRNFGRHIPMPFAATVDGAPNKTLPVTASVQRVHTVAPDSALVIVPTPDNPYNWPYVWIEIDASGAATTGNGVWFGVNSPQFMFGEVPDTGNIDSRAVQFKGAIFETEYTTAYNNASALRVIDPYNTFAYGKVNGIYQIEDMGFTSTGRYSSQPRSWPYFTNPADFEGTKTDVINRVSALATNKPVVGSSNDATVHTRQTIVPHGCVYAPCLPMGADPGDLEHCGWFDPMVQGDLASRMVTLSRYGQGMYVFDNFGNSSPSVATIRADYHYRCRVDRDQLSVYMMADEVTTMPQPIDFNPQVTLGPARVTTIQQHMIANKASTEAIKLNTIPPVATAATIDKKSSVSDDVTRSLSGLHKVITGNGRVGDMVEGVSEFASGVSGLLGRLF